MNEEKKRVSKNFTVHANQRGLLSKNGRSIQSASNASCTSKLLI